MSELKNQFQVVLQLGAILNKTLMIKQLSILPMNLVLKMDALR